MTPGGRAGCAVVGATDSGAWPTGCIIASVDLFPQGSGKAFRRLGIESGDVDAPLLGAPGNDNGTQQKCNPHEINLESCLSDVVEERNGPQGQGERGEAGKRLEPSANRPVAGDQE